MAKSSIASRGDPYRSKAIGCQRAAQFAARADTRELMMKLATQWRDIAEQLDRLELLTGLRPK
jgi:hypothetical protein